MRVSWRSELPMWLLIGAQFLLAAGSWPDSPDSVPTRWALDGNVDGYGDRFQGLLLLPLVSLGLYLALLFAPQVGPRRENYPHFAGSYTLLRFAVLALMTAMYGMIQLAMRGYPVPVTRVIPLSIGALFLVIGSQMGRLRPNWFAGPRSPWTLSSELSWYRTNRLAGWLLIAAGAMLLLAGLLGSALLMAATVAATVLGALGLIGYSYRVWAADPNKNGADPI
jgi:uncharacterized membrane protein